MADEPQEKPVDTTKERPGCWRRALSCACWLLLVVFALLLVSYLVEVYRCSRFTPTGDALFDRYARAVISRQAWRLFHGGGTHPATLPDELLAEWESDFGADPEYWQLRYWCRFNKYSGLPWQWSEYPDNQDSIEATHWLREARSRGIADAQTLTVLYLAIDDQLEWTSGEGSADFLKLKQELGSIASEISASEPDYSWAYYVLAVSSIREERYEDALASIIAGNVCRKNAWPACFPRFVALNQCTQIDPPNKALYGAILSTQSEYPISWYDVQRCTPGFFDWAVARNNANEISACHKFACRVGSAWGNTAGVDLAPMLILQVAYSTLEQNAEQYTTEQRRVVFALVDRLRRLQRELSWYYGEAKSRTWMLEPYNVVDLVASYVYYPPGSVVDCPLLVCANFYYYHHPDGMRLYARKVSNELHNHEAHTWGEFENMALLDYETLELPYDWWDIGAQNGFPECHSQWMIDQGYIRPELEGISETSTLPLTDN